MARRLAGGKTQPARHRDTAAETFERVLNSAGLEPAATGTSTALAGPQLATHLCATVTDSGVEAEVYVVADPIGELHAAAVEDTPSPARVVWWQAAEGDGDLLRSRPHGTDWTPQELARDIERTRAALAVLAGRGVSVPDLLKTLQAGREAHNKYMRDRGFVWVPPSRLNVSAWLKHPHADHIATRRQRDMQLQDWLPFDDVEEASSKDRVELMRRDLAGLEQWGAYERPSAPQGRPELGIAPCLVELRRALPRQCGSHPVWEFVAALARVTFPESLAPTFGGARAKALVVKYRQRRV